MLHPLVGVTALASPLEVGAARAPRAARDLARCLRQAGCRVIPLGPIGSPDEAVAAGKRLAAAAGDGPPVDAVACAVASWFEDYLVLDLLEECRLPVLLWPLPGMETGALCGAQQLNCYLQQLGVPCELVFGPAEDAADASGRGRAFLRAAALRNRLRRARVGWAGTRVSGMTETAANEFALKQTLGPRLVPLDLPGLFSRAKEIPLVQARRVWRKVTGAAGACQVAEADGLDSMQVYLAVREQVRKHGLAALTIGCYPHLMGRVCLAASLLADEGVPLGCEGDANGAVGQLMLTWLSGQPTHNTDWLEPLEDGSVILTHCGSGSLSLAAKKEDVKLASVRLMGQGVCALFPARPGPVTLVNLLPRGAGYQLAWLEGEALPTEMVFPGNPLRVRFPRPTPEVLAWIQRAGLGHHWMAGYGHYAAELRALAALVGPGLMAREMGN